MEVLTETYVSTRAAIRDAASASSQVAPASAAIQDEERNLDQKIEESISYRVSVIMAVIDKENREIKDMQKKLSDALSHNLADVIDAEQPRHIVGCSGEGQYHWVAPFSNAILEKWTATCGWRYAFSDFDRCWSVPDEVHYERICKICLPKLRKQG